MRVLTDRQTDGQTGVNT